MQEKTTPPMEQITEHQQAERKLLESLAAEAGIAASYINAHGKQQAISAETKQRLLEAMHPFTPTQVGSPVPPVMVFTQGRPCILNLNTTGEYTWTLALEAHASDKSAPTATSFQGKIQRRKTLTLPRDLPLGYHQLTLSDETQQWTCQIIVTPQRCYEPDALLTGRKLWGACVQLYTLRSDNNWGIGDFGDLKQMVLNVAKRGGAFVGLNPIHSLYPANPESASPYSPSSRRWLNVAYIDVNQVEEFKLSDEAQTWWNNTETQRRLSEARASEWVDYSSVISLKINALQRAFPAFIQQKSSSKRLKAFRQFVEQGGHSLYQQAAFDALHAHLNAQDPTMWGWPVWPDNLRSADSNSVADFCRQHADKVDFYLWLQWLAYSQLSECFEVCQQQKMPIGLYRDLAVGVAEGGAETWGETGLYCLKASVGAPPDILGPLGQNWGLPPMDPHVMAARAYQPFIDMLRANMTCCGALRIDHVMSMLRLWWIPYGETADKGAYVRYPVDDLLAILALESQRNQCMVIGEDLGTVPVEIIAKLRDCGVYSYKVLYFEHDQENSFRAPQSYTVQAMATITTHDLPTLRGYWQADDLHLGSELGLYPDLEVLRKLHQDREAAKQGLLDGLHQYGCIPQKVGRRADRLAMSPVLNRGLQRYVADSASALLGLQPEDWLDMEKPVNIPGTSDQYPNWRRKLTHTLEQMFSDPDINLLISDLDKRRRKVSAA